MDRTAVAKELVRLASSIAGGNRESAVLIKSRKLEMARRELANAASSLYKATSLMRMLTKEFPEVDELMEEVKVFTEGVTGLSDTLMDMNYAEDDEGDNQ